MRKRLAFCSVAVSILLGSARNVRAVCNALPPGVASQFRGARGSVDRPLAGPGDVVRLTLDPCVVTEPAFPDDPADVVLTFDLHDDGDRHVMLHLATDCATLDEEVARCAQRPDVERAVCLEASAGDLTVVDRRTFDLRVPDTTPLATDGLTGPVTLLASSRGATLPCNTIDPCRSPDTIACVGDLFAAGTCATVPSPLFDAMTLLPATNDYRKLCAIDGNGCTGAATELRAAVDRHGNLLVPFAWDGVLPDDEGIPNVRLVAGWIGVRAFEGSRAPLTIPSVEAIQSFSPEGAVMPRFFFPGVRSAADGTLRFLASSDAPRSVVRLNRWRPGLRRCQGGDASDRPCGSDQDCPAGACASATCERTGRSCASSPECNQDDVCGGPLFDFAGRRRDTFGPVVLGTPACVGGSRAGSRCVASDECPAGFCEGFSFASLEATPLSGIARNDVVTVAIESERLDDRDYNLDGDVADEVLHVHPTGGTAPSFGRAVYGVTRVIDPPFSAPAIALTNDVLAFLEPESMQGNADLNGDGDAADSILRLVGADGEIPSTGRPIVAATAPFINDHALVALHDRLFIRRPEGADVATVSRPIDTPGLTIEWASPAFSGDGRRLAFVARRTNVAGAPTQVFVWDAHTGSIQLGSVSPTGEDGDADSTEPSLSSDGRFLVFRSGASNLLPAAPAGVERIYLRDVDSSTTTLVSAGLGGSSPDGSSSAPVVSADGRCVVFGSTATNLVADDDNGVSDVFLYSTMTGALALISRTFAGPGNGPSDQPDVSDDCQVVVFTSTAHLTQYDVGPFADVFAWDRPTERITRVSHAGGYDDSLSGDGPSHSPSVSGDGRYVAFTTTATNIVKGDVNGFDDVLVRDRQLDLARVVSRSSAGSQPHGHSGAPTLARDGGMVVFASSAPDLAPDLTSGALEIFAHDLSTDTTVVLPVTAAGTRSPADATAVSADATAIAFPSMACGGIRTSTPRLCTRTPDADAQEADLSGDGDANDTVLEVLDLRTGFPINLGPADRVWTDGDQAVFLVPEASTSQDLNGDGDRTDRVVADWMPGRPVRNLRLAARDVRVSPAGIAALVSEVEQHQDLDGDGRLDGDVLHVLPAGAEDWINTGFRADAMVLDGSLLAFRRLEPEGDVLDPADDLNGDSQGGDRVLHVYDMVTGVTSNVGYSVETFAVRGRRVAFDTFELLQGGDLNGDHDNLDRVLSVYDADQQRVLNTTVASGVLPCQFEGCTRERPFELLDHTVTYVASEGAADVDLNGDGDRADFVLQILNLAALPSPADGVHRSSGSTEPAIVEIAAVSSGVCSGDGTPCLTDFECGEECFVPPGGCIVDTGISCEPGRSGAPPGCGPLDYCQPLPGTTTGRCRRVAGGCVSDADCPASATCNNIGQPYQRALPFLPLATGDKVFVTSGRCRHDEAHACASTDDCSGQAICDRGSCFRIEGACRSQADCPEGSFCRPDLRIATAADTDMDEIPDFFDNCPADANTAQADRDADGRGDVCDPVDDCGSRGSLESLRCGIRSILLQIRRLSLYDDGIRRLLEPSAQKVVQRIDEVATARRAALRRIVRRITGLAARLRSLYMRRHLAPDARERLVASLLGLRAEAREMLTDAAGSDRALGIDGASR